jgi:uncharacterized protein YkwD
MPYRHYGRRGDGWIHLPLCSIPAQEKPQRGRTRPLHGYKGHNSYGRLPVVTGRLGILIVLALLVSCESIHNAVLDGKSSTYSPAHSTAGQESTTRAQAPLDSKSPQWTKETVDTTAGVEYLTDNERQVIIEINMARTDPAEYARSFLVPLRSYYRDTLLQYPGEIAILTHEGIGALDECIRELHVTKPLSSLSPMRGLTLAARDQARDQAITGATGHTGSDRSTPIDRINRYGQWDISAGENIDYGNGDARRIVTSQLIDDGVASRGHRMNLLSRSFKFVGVSVGAHDVYRHMCVMDFAGSYR